LVGANTMIKSARGHAPPFGRVFALALDLDYTQPHNHRLA
jgi:hypothetical protein